MPAVSGYQNAGADPIALVLGLREGQALPRPGAAQFL